MAHYIHSSYLGLSHLHRLHVRYLHPAQVVHPLNTSRAAARRRPSVGMVYRQEIPPAEQVCQSQLRV